jgi:hypothetical protein
MRQKIQTYRVNDSGVDVVGVVVVVVVVGGGGGGSC